MRLNNLEIRMLIEKRRLFYWQVARAAGIDPTTLSKWLQQELSQERKERILKAIEELN